MSTLNVFIGFDYVITIWYSYLHVIISELIQSKPALNQRCSALKTQCFRAESNSVSLRWLRTDALWNSADFFVLNSADSEEIRADQLWNSTVQNCLSLWFQPGFNKLWWHKIEVDNRKQSKEHGKFHRHWLPALMMPRFPCGVLGGDLTTHWGFPS